MFGSLIFPRLGPSSCEHARWSLWSLAKCRMHVVVFHRYGMDATVTVQWDIHLQMVGFPASYCMCFKHQVSCHLEGCQFAKIGSSPHKYMQALFLFFGVVGKKHRGATRKTTHCIWQRSPLRCERHAESCGDTGSTVTKWWLGKGRILDRQFEQWKSILFGCWGYVYTYIYHMYIYLARIILT